jgi:O-antigen/teichoic acid export membrane protein
MTFKAETLLSSSSVKELEKIYNDCVTLSLTCFLIYTLFYLLVVFLFNTDFSITVFLALVSGLLFSLITTTITYLLRQKQKLYVTIQKPIRRIVEVLTLILFINFYKLPFSLEISTIVGLTASALPLLQKSRLRLSSIGISIQPQLNLLKKSKSVMIGEVFNTLSLSFLSFFVFMNYSINDLGVLELSFKILSIPQLLICSVLAIIIQNNIGALVSERKPILNNIRQFFFFLAIMSTLFTLTIFLGAEIVISTLFEDQWSKSINYTKLLLPHLFFFIIFSPLSRVLYALMDNKAIRNWQFLKLLLILSTLFFYNKPLNEFLFIYAIVSAFSYLLLIWVISNSIRKYHAKLEVL